MTVYTYKKHFISDNSDGNSKSISRLVFLSMGALSAALLCLSVFSMTSDKVSELITTKNGGAIDDYTAAEGGKSKNSNDLNLPLFRAEDEKTTEVFHFDNNSSIRNYGDPIQEEDEGLGEQGLCDYLPRIYDSSVGILKRVGREMMLHHRWLSPIVHYSEYYSRLHRLGPLAVESICFCFFNAAVYTYTDPDDGSCATFMNERDCITKYPHKCYWVKSTHDCYFSQPAVSLSVIVVVVVISAVASAIISRFVEGIVLKIVFYRKNRNRRPKFPISAGNKAQQNSSVDKGRENDGGILERVIELFSSLHFYRSGFTGRHGSIQPIARSMTPLALRQPIKFRRGEKPSRHTGHSGDAIGMKCRSYIFQLPLEADIENLQAGLREHFLQLDEDAAERFAGAVVILPFEMYLYEKLIILYFLMVITGDWGIDKSGYFIRSSILTSESPSLFQIENRSDVLLGDIIQMSKETACRELEMLHFNDTANSSLQEKPMGSNNGEDNFPSNWKNIIAKRMTYLLYHDLLASKIACRILENKSNRDCLLINTPDTPYVWQYCAGDNYASIFSLLTYFPAVRTVTVFLVWVLCIAMGVYVLYFAYTQTMERQLAWAESFALWLAMDAIVISSLDVLVTSVFIPLLIQKDVNTAGESIASLMRSYASKFSERPGGMMSGPATPHFTQRQLMPRKTKMARIEESGNQEEWNDEFNAADFFFASFRLAKYFSDIPLAKAIISYRTCDPPGHTYVDNQRVSLSAWYRCLRPVNYFLKEKPGNQSAFIDQSNGYVRSPQYSGNAHLPHFWSEFKGPFWFVQYRILNILGFFIHCSVYVQNTAFQIALILTVGALAELHIYIFNHYASIYLVAPTALLLVVCLISYFLLRVLDLLMLAISTMTAAISSIASRLPSTRPRSRPVTPLQQPFSEGYDLDGNVKRDGNDFDSNEVVEFDLPESKMDIEDHAPVFLPRQLDSSSSSSNNHNDSAPELDLAVEDFANSPEEEEVPSVDYRTTAVDSREEESAHNGKITVPLPESGGDADNNTSKLSRKRSTMKRKDFGSRK